MKDDALIVHMYETGRNTLQTKDGKIGGEKYMFPKDDMAYVTGYDSSCHFKKLTDTLSSILLVYQYHIFTCGTITYYYPDCQLKIGWIYQIFDHFLYHFNPSIFKHTNNHTIRSLLDRFLFIFKQL